MQSSRSTQSRIWASTIPLSITHASSPTPYLLNIPRLSYLPLLLPRLTSFFNLDSGSASSFYYSGIALKNLPIGLLFDLYQPETLPWKLELGEGFLYDIHDTYFNSVKEADFLRNGSAKGIMGMSKGDSQRLWEAVMDNDLAAFNQINTRLLNPASPLKHIPMRVYIPQSSATDGSQSTQASQNPTSNLGAYKTVQMLIPTNTGGGSRGEPQTVGSALNKMLPSLFPSRRDAVLADVVLHGARLPLDAPVEEVMREAAYADGWVGLVVVMLA